MTKNNPEPIKLNRTLHIALTSLEKFPWLHLFPVAFDNKAQPLLKDYLKRASNDPAQIRRWHAYWRAQFKGQGCWWGVAPALSGLVFADIDTKSGKPGQQTFEFPTRDARENGRVGDLVAVQVQDGQHRAIAGRTQELV